MTTRRRTTRASAVIVALAAATAAASAFSTAQAGDRAPGDGAAPVTRVDPAPRKDHVDHDLDGPFSKQQKLNRQAALEQVISGDATVQKRGASKVVKLDEGKYVELGREKTDKIFTILVEFGDKVDDTTLHDPDGPEGPKPPVKKYGGTPGPLHNRIAEPDRKVNNSTIWQKDYNREHFEDLYFGTGKDAAGQPKHSVKTYFEKASSGRYSVDGAVSDWVKVEWNEARYGSNYCGENNCVNAWDAVRDGVNAWVADQKAKGRTDEQIKATLAEYDVWGRNDHDGDGNFNERDGYIDHFQFVHAGEDESAGGGAQGTDALWAHRWYAYGSDNGRTGPAFNKAGGTQIGGTGVWVGDYTVQPENGGLGVFAHEYGHDLGLPDLYDYTGENSTGFWSLMSAGSWLNNGKDTIGEMPGDMTAWDKLQLGWLNYTKGKAATASTHTLGVSAFNTKRPQALVVELPKKPGTRPVVKPSSGEKQWWSDLGDDLQNTLTRSVDLTGRSTASLELTGWWQIEKDYDFLYTEVSADNGATWTPVDGTANGAPITRDGGGKPGLTGRSGGHKALVYPLNGYAGKKIDVRFHYRTDGATADKGFTADDVVIKADGATLFSDGAETEAAGWTSKGFSRVGASYTKDYEQYYIAENRQYVSYDKTLQVGPYNFGFQAPKNQWVERYPYQNGLLIWLWDTFQLDNNVGSHPGEGLVLPIDANPTPLKWSDGTLIRNRIQAFDSTFSTRPYDGFTLHKGGVPTRVPAKKGVSVFDDRKGVYWSPANPTQGVKTADTNTKISIVKEPRSGETITVKVGPSTK
ncbi:immune inhibitor A [Streptomyces clavuligerus]|uniref:immune inhibitor A domain-containing protein n=1 Tax=Streptomyces clavuligerus TaxID=1901 RepID=UPI000810759F|nr:immune inhibitor A domain-containing protein [Streptomyces clavuligerus]ANW20004.1 protease [Streptomyces clavuligerus]AXU14631.1 M6 family metalloprotease domain-containing protein [Streptomyces clavuligerus]QPL64643.1 immune inhibitor A [Streptomyces clavuligerus]QPL70673.1 immune inhibitor A [Streptomyces clavuligerus]QPL76756.1 immune inhibitor A [Streptomyces clavuligerus]